jgi:hypothetical protein
MSNRIFARSPYIITINETGQTSSKIDIFLWNGTGSAPTSPTYTLSKAIPSSTAPSTYYDVSPYIREYINFNLRPINYNSTGTTLGSTTYCNVKIKRYKNTGTLLDTTTYYAFDGYAEYSDGYNYDRGQYLLDEGDYYYHYDSGSSYINTKAGDLTLEVTSGQKAVYTNLVTGAFISATFPTSGLKTAFRVYAAYWADGNKLEIKTSADAVLRTYTFLPKEECKHQVLPIDFVNKYGAWQREFLFKASNDSFNMTNQEFNIMNSSITSFKEFEGQKKTFNANGKDSIKCNTGWVKESFKETIKEIMLSEKIILNDLPVTIKTKQTELFKSINTKNINYALEFDYSFDTIMSII